MENRAPMVGPKMKPREKDTPTKACGSGGSGTEKLMRDNVCTLSCFCGVV